MIDEVELDLQLESARDALWAFASRVPGDSKRKSEMDNDIVRIRYKYDGGLSDDSREFCKKMVRANRVWRKEDIEAADLAQFGVAPPKPESENAGDDDDIGNSPGAVIPDVVEDTTLSPGRGDIMTATDGGNAPVISAEPEEQSEDTDLESVRDGLQRRNEEGGS